MTLFDKEKGRIFIENGEKKYEMSLNEIVNVSLSQENTCEEKPLNEVDMYALFYEAFNIYGSFEDQFIYSVATEFNSS